MLGEKRQPRSVDNSESAVGNHTIPFPPLDSFPNKAERVKTGIVRKRQEKGMNIIRCITKDEHSYIIVIQYRCEYCNYNCNHSFDTAGTDSHWKQIPPPAMSSHLSMLQATNRMTKQQKNGSDSIGSTGTRPYALNKSTTPDLVIEGNVSVIQEKDSAKKQRKYKPRKSMS